MLRVISYASDGSEMRIVPASDSSLLVEFGRTISPEFHEQVLALFRLLASQGGSRIRNLHPAYSSLLIDFDPMQWTHEELTAQVRELIYRDKSSDSCVSRAIALPVCYDPEFGPDLSDVAAIHHISVSEVIRLHASATYLVYFLGFSPGFAYLGGLPEQLRTPRLATPRGRVAVGSVGIAGDQTGVYPIESAGGWRIIGRTPVRMFEVSGDPPTRLRLGDVVRFDAIDRLEFDRILQAQRK